MGRRFGFTLAEVLITLAIIGVVAVLTIPTLVANYQEKGWNTAATVFERKLEESLKVMNTQGTLAGYKTTKDFVNELSKHIKIIKVCENNDLTSCFEDKVMFGAGEAEPEEVEISKIKTAKNFGQKEWSIDTEVLGFQLNNGTNGLIAYNPDCRQDQFSNQITGKSCVAVLYDTSGFTKPNTSGKDLRAINVTQLGKACAFEIGGTCYGAPFIPTPMTYAECTGEEASALGISECHFEEDYWAGAVKACGGTKNMPTINQLAVIANYVYDTEKATTMAPVQNLTRDDNKVASLGFQYNSSSMFSVWSNAVLSFNTRNVQQWEFNTSSTRFANIARFHSTVQAVCIVD